MVSKFNRSTGKDGNSKSVKNSSERIVSKRTDTVAFIDKSSEKGRTKRKKNK